MADMKSINDILTYISLICGILGHMPTTSSQLIAAKALYDFQHKVIDMAFSADTLNRNLKLQMHHDDPVR